MRLIRRVFVSAFIVVPILCAVAVVAVPGPHRVLAPTSFGLTRIATGIYTDAPSRSTELQNMLKAAERDVMDFFGSLTPRWRTVLCTTSKCKEAFGMTGRAIALGDLAIVTAPSGVRKSTLMHEQIHIELSARMGLIDAIWPRYPSWFNEGLAMYLSGTPNVPGPTRVSEAQWITAAQTPLGWRLAKRGRAPAEYYGAARRMIAEVDRRIGRAELLDMVNAVADGADFSTELQARLDR